jgi:hypothetical protein
MRNTKISNAKLQMSNEEHKFQTWIFSKIWVLAFGIDLNFEL